MKILVLFVEPMLYITDLIREVYEKAHAKLFESSEMKSECFTELSIGMSDDYPIAIEYGSTMVRIGSMIFGSRS